LPIPTRQQYSFLLLPGILVILGVGVAVRSMNYGIGSFTRMGPGFAPMVLGITLALLGAFIIWQDRNTAEAWVPPAWRPFLAITTGILAWAGLAESAGFFIATLAQVIICSLALPNLRWRHVLILSGLVAIFGYLLFIIQLGVPLEALG